MYIFNIDSAIGKVISSQRRAFWKGFSKLKGQSRGIESVATKKGDEVSRKTYFVYGAHRGCAEEIYDVYTRDRKNKKFFFITTNGEFVRFWSEKDMFNLPGPSQHVYTVLSSDGKSVYEIRAMVDEENNKEVVKEEDMELYHRLFIARKGAEANLKLLQYKEDSFSL